jgi:hypothetical protein
MCQLMQYCTRHPTPLNRSRKNRRIRRWPTAAQAEAQPLSTDLYECTPVYESAGARTVDEVRKTNIAVTRNKESRPIGMSVQHILVSGAVRTQFYRPSDDVNMSIGVPDVKEQKDKAVDQLLQNIGLARCRNAAVDICCAT